MYIKLYVNLRNERLLKNPIYPSLSFPNILPNMISESGNWHKYNPLLLFRFHQFYTYLGVCVCVCLLCCVLCLVTQSCPTLWTVADPWTVAHQAPLSIRILQARILSGSPCPPCVCVSVSSVQSLSRVWLFGTLWTPWTAAVYVFSSMQFYNMCFLFFFERKKPPDYRLLEF